MNVNILPVVMHLEVNLAFVSLFLLSESLVALPYNICRVQQCLPACLILTMLHPARIAKTF